MEIFTEGWSVMMDDAGVISETNGLDYIMDLVSELELISSFPTKKSSILKIGNKRPIPSEVDCYNCPPTNIRPAVPPPEPPLDTFRKISRETNKEREVRQSSPMPHHSSHENSRKTSRDTREIYTQSPIDSSSPSARKTSHDALSRNSALNERYFDVEKTRSRSLDNLLSEPEPSPLSDLGLSHSKLNERYHSVEQLVPIKPVIANVNYLPKQEMEFEYPDVSSVDTSHRGGPRYIKSAYVGKRPPPGSQSSRAQIEKSDFGGMRSSAMSDTSEAPSLASHVRRVRVPSQASDVDQFLDELFSPVLDGNLDELSDARSLAASIKGSRLDKEFDSFENPMRLKGGNFKNGQCPLRLRGGGLHTRNDSQDNSMLEQQVENLNSSQAQSHSSKLNGNINVDKIDLLRPLVITENLKKISEKHGSSAQNGASTSAFGFPSLSTPLINPASVMMPLLGSSQESFVPMFNLSGVSGGHSPDIAIYQQNLQRAFLQSAMAQNIQIQQQLLAQNQALQQLLTQQHNSLTTDVKITENIQTSVAQINQSNIQANPSRRQSFIKSGILNRKSTSLTTNDYKLRKVSSESNGATGQKNGIPPPPPPPLPPPLDGTDPSEVRPFMDPYGRAKTVRIGKWRWPPPKDGKNVKRLIFIFHFTRFDQEIWFPKISSHTRRCERRNPATTLLSSLPLPLIPSGTPSVRCRI